MGKYLGESKNQLNYQEIKKTERNIDKLVNFFGGPCYLNFFGGIILIIIAFFNTGFGRWFFFLIGLIGIIVGIVGFIIRTTKRNKF